MKREFFLKQAALVAAFFIALAPIAVAQTNPGQSSLSIPKGGTGAATASQARINLGVAIGSNVEAWDADLDCIAALSSTGFVARTGAGTCAVRTFIVTSPIQISNGDGVAGAPSLSLIANGISNTLFRQSSALSLVGRSANSTGDVADISATAASDCVFREGSSSIACGQVATAGHADNSITNAKLRQGGALSLIGRSANSTGNVADISATAASDCVFRESGSALGCGQIATAGVANNAITNAKAAQMAANSFKCNNTASPANAIDCTAAQVKTVLAIALSDISGFGSGVSTFLATPSSANLASALPDETGSGSVVFSASPVLTGTPTTPTAAVDTNTQQIASTAFVLAQASASGDGNPAMDGSAARGTSTHYARSDHVHPSDTSRAPTSRSIATGAGLSGGGDLSADRTLKVSRPVNPQTGTTYTVQSTDQAKLVVFTNASPVAVTLPAASTFGANWEFDVLNLGAGTVTITPTTSTINGVGALALTTGQGAHIFSDGTNYFVQSGAGSGSGTVTSVVCNGGTVTITTTGSCPSREALAANRTYYVRSDGDDSACNGKSNAAVASAPNCAFATIQKAWNTTITLDLAGYTVTIKLATTSTFAGLSATSPAIGGTVIIEGDTGTPANTLIAATSDAISLNGGARLQIQSLKIQTTTGGNCGIADGAGTKLTLGTGVVLGACANVGFMAQTNGEVRVASGLTVAGNMTAYYWVQNGGVITSSSTITMSGTPAFSTAGIVFDTGGAITLYGSTSFSGSATGKRYQGTMNALLQSFGAGTVSSFFPGNSNGTTATGAQQG